MTIVDAIPRDVHVIADFSISSLKKFKTVLDNMTFNYNSNDSAHVEAKEYLEQVLYPAITNALETYSDGS